VEEEGTKEERESFIKGRTTPSHYFIDLWMLGNTEG